MVGMLLTVLVLTPAGLAGWAQNAPVQGDDSRYTFHQVDGGYLRLDGRTGQVSICTPRAAGWACQTVADERTALEAEIARLQAENIALKKELLAHNLALPDTVKPGEPTLKPEEPSRLQLPTDAEFNQMMAFVEKVWRRLVDMVGTLQKDTQRQSQP